MMHAYVTVQSGGMGCNLLLIEDKECISSRCVCSMVSLGKITKFFPKCSCHVDASSGSCCRVQLVVIVFSVIGCMTGAA